LQVASVKISENAGFLYWSKRLAILCSS